MRSRDARRQSHQMDGQSFAASVGYGERGPSLAGAVAPALPPLSVLAV